MPLAPVNIADGQVSGVDSLSSAASSVINWDIDEAGINRPRATLQTYTQTGLGAFPVRGVVDFGMYTLVACYDAAQADPITATAGHLQNLRVYYINRVFPTVAAEASPASNFDIGLSRPTFVSATLKVYMAAGNYIQSWVPTAPSTLTTLSTTIPSVTHIASLGQRLICNSTASPNQFFWSDIGEGAWNSWPTANTSQADARPDPIVALAENTNELIIWGTQTTQVYVVGNDPTLPFDPISTINTGLGAPYAFCRFDEQWTWLDEKRRIVMSDGRSVQSISDAIQKDLRGLSYIADAFAYRLEYDQFSYLVYRFPTARRTFAYNTKSQKWSERQTYTAPFNTDHPVGAYLYRESDGSHLFGSSGTTGGLYTLSTSIGSEIGAPLACERTTGWNDFGIPGSKRMGRLRIALKRGQGAEATTPGALEVQWQDDDSAWSAWEQISVGTPSEFQNVVDVFTAGIVRRRRYRFRFTNTEAFALATVHQDFTDLERS